MPVISVPLKRLRRSGGRPARRIHHQDAALRGGIDVDVVHADSGTADDSQTRGLLDEFLIDHRSAPNDDAIRFRNKFEELLSGDLVVDDRNDRARSLEELYPGRINSIQ